MDKDIWISSVSDYRSMWVIRLYVEIYKGNDHYTTIYYDIEKDTWGYKDKKKHLEVNFQWAENKVKELLINDLGLQYKENMTFNKMSNYKDYSIYLTHNEFTTEFQRKKLKNIERDKLLKEQVKKNARCECGGKLFYEEVCTLVNSQIVKDINTLDSDIWRKEGNTEDKYLRCMNCNQKYDVVIDENKKKYFKGDKRKS